MRAAFTPAQAQARLPELPDEVISSFEDLIVHHLKGGSATIDRGEVTGLISERMEISMEEVEISDWWSDVVDVFRKSGWSASYKNKANPPVLIFNTPTEYYDDGGK